MSQVVSKSKFKPRALEYFRQVEQSREEIIITDHGKPVLKVIPFAGDPEGDLEALRGTVLRYDDPTEPVALEDWEALS